jgi:hypothetical protein
MTIRVTIACNWFYDFGCWIKGRIIQARWKENQERDAYMRQHSRYDFMWRCMRKYYRHPRYACCTCARCKFSPLTEIVKVTAITTCDQKHKFATTVTHLRLQTHLCGQRHIIATTVTHSRLQSHICVYSHTFATAVTCSSTCYFLRLYIYIGVPRRRKGSSLFSFMRTQTSYH